MKPIGTVYFLETNSILKAIVGLKILIQKLQGSDITDLKNKILGSDLGRLNEILLQNDIKLPIKRVDEWNRFWNVLKDASLQDYIVLIFVYMYYICK